MTAVQLNCPHCVGIFQAESTWAGRQVSCPLCNGMVTVPDVPRPPPPADAAPSSGLLEGPEESAPRDVATLLPPSIMGEPGVLPGKQVPLPAGEPAATGGPNEPILIPIAQGTYVSVSEPVKTVGSGPRERELRRLNPQEKARRRARKNIIMAVMGLVLLIVAAWVLMRIG